jgi:hypothetical protein
MIRQRQIVTFALCALTSVLGPGYAGEAVWAQGAGKTPDPNKIVDQYVRAAGGAKVLSRIKTLTIEGAISGEGGAKSGTYAFDIKLPNRYYTELNIGSEAKNGPDQQGGAQHLITAYNGKSAWRQIEEGKYSTLLGTDALQVEAASRYYNLHFLNAKKARVGVAYVGHEQWGGREIDHLEFTMPEGLKRGVYFDSGTHLIAKESAKVAGIDEEMLYDDYRAVDGMRIPFRIEYHRGKDTYQIGVTRAVVNGVIGERVFDFPIKSQAQLPDLKALFKEIDANQKAIDKIKENYSGSRTEEEMEYDNAGKEKNREINEYTFFYMNGEEISTLVKKNGKALTEAEQDKENEKVRKRIEEAQKRQANKEAKEEKAKEQGKQDEDVGIETFLRVSQFVNPRRERFRGQDVLVFDFEPNPEYRPHGMIEGLVGKLAGVVWIDENAHDVVRLEAYFVNDFRIAGGLLANLQKGTSFIFEQSYVNNEVWLPTYEEAHVGVRLLLVKGLKVNAITRYADYKKFDIKDVTTIAPPKQQPQN